MALRRSVLLPLAACAALLAAACSSGPGAAPVAATSSPTTGSAAYPVTLATEFGAVTVEAAPERVVALGWGDAETALALGVQPVGASDWLGFGGEGVGPWSAGSYDAPPTLIGTLEPELEEVAALDPDLILDVNSSGDAERHEALAKIAPVLGVPPGKASYATGWRDQMTMISTALGKAEEGAALVAEVDAAFAATAAEYPQFKGRTIAIASRTAEGWGAYVEPDGRVAFVEALGFENAPEVEELSTGSFTVEVSEENVDLLDADLTVAIPIFVDASAVTGDRLFQQVPSVADGRLVVLAEGDLSKAFSISTVPALQYALEEVPPLFAKALDRSAP